MKEDRFNDSHRQKVLVIESLNRMLGIPQQRVALNAEYRGNIVIDDVVVEKWIWTSEPGSLVTSLLYLPRKQNGKLPGIVITNGHGGSKNSDSAQYAGQLYAKLGMACLLHDTIGEEERHANGEMGTRAHDHPEAVQRADFAGRLILGKICFDASRAIDFLSGHERVDADRIGVAGNSLGGTVATWLAALDDRLKVAIISGCGFTELNGNVCKPCCAIPSQRMQDLCSYSQLLSIAVSHCAVLSMNGTLDDVVTQGRSNYWEQHLAAARGCGAITEECETARPLELWFQPDGGHRAYHLHPRALKWLSEYLLLPDWTPQRIPKLSTITLEQWYKKYDLQWPENSRTLYWVDKHHKGGVYLDLDIIPIQRRKLQCLSDEEVGDPLYTLEGWLEIIKKHQNPVKKDETDKALAAAER